MSDIATVSNTLVGGGRKTSLVYNPEVPEEVKIIT